MEEWQSTFATDRSYERRSGRAAVSVGKRWIGQIVDVRGEAVSLLMYSSRPGIDGNEIWTIDLETGSTIRFRLGGEPVESVARNGDHWFGLLVGDAAIIRFGFETHTGE